MKEHNHSIRKLNEWSILNNKTIIVYNKPKHLKNKKTGFELTPIPLRT